MAEYNICFLGFGNVGRALARLFGVKSAELAQAYDIQWKITGVATRRMGWLVNEEGFNLDDLLSGKVDQPNKVGEPTKVDQSSKVGEPTKVDQSSKVGEPTKVDQSSKVDEPSKLYQPSKVDQSNRVDQPNTFTARNIDEWLERAQPAAVLETTSLNVENGQPAIDYLRAALRAGAHAITANKGTVVFGYDELSELAQQAGKRYLFESTVLDSAPVFSLFRECLPAVKLRGFAGVFNSTTNVILEAMETGRTFDEGVQVARELGVTETDPSHDVDGWDSTVKICALATVLLKIPIKPDAVRREGIRGLDPKSLRVARAEGRPFKLVSRARVEADGSISASVRPEQLVATDPLSCVRGTSLAAHFELDMMPGLTIMSHRPNLQSTAYGLLADFINAVRIGGL